MRMQLTDALAAINAVLAKTSEMNCPASEIRSVEYDTADPCIVVVKVFGMNDEPLTFAVTADPMDDLDLVATLTEGEVL